MNTPAHRPTLLFSLTVLLPVFLVFLILPSPSAIASDELPFDVFVMPPEPISGLEIHWEDLFGPDASGPDSYQLRGPHHGEITTTSVGLHYAARTSLWQVKVDSFILDYQIGLQRHAINVGIVVGKAHPGEPLSNAFDEPVTGNLEWSLHDPTDVTDVAGSMFWVPGSTLVDSYVFAWIDEQNVNAPPEDIYDRTHPGSSTTGTGGGIRLTPPPGGLTGGGLTSNSVVGQVFYAAGPTGSIDSIRGWLRQGLSGSQARIEAIDAADVWHSSPWVNLPSQPLVWLKVEYDHSEDAPERARLQIDEVLVAHTPEMESGDVPLELNEHRFGILQPQPGVALDLEADQVEVYRYKIHGEEEPQHTDDFESGAAADWSSTTGTGLTVVDRPSVGRHWLRSELASGDSFLTDATPSAADSVRLRFDFDTSGLSAQTVKVLAAHSSDHAAGADELLQVLVRQQLFSTASQFQVRVKDNLWQTTGWLPLAQSVNHLELTFRAATTPASADGEVAIWLNGAPLPSISGLANHTSLIEAARFGAMDVATGASSRIDLDNYQLWVPHVIDP